MKNKILALSLMCFFITPLLYAEDEHKGSHSMVAVSDNAGEISHYTCGMHPSIRVSVENFDGGDTKCPICFMPLTSVTSQSNQTMEFDEHVISKVEIKARALKLAGVQTEIVKKRKLFKEIRAVGRVAYDPELAIAQDEFISSIKSFEKSKTGEVSEIIGRSKSLVDSSRRKLFLLGLSEEQIEELEINKKVQMNLILPGEKMWIYGDVYEYELPWVKKGSYIKAKPIGFGGPRILW